MMGYKEIWFITGATTGFGRYLLKGLRQNDHRVAAISRDGVQLQKWAGPLTEDLLCLTVDLTSEDSVQKAIQQTIRRFGRIDNVVNYAGYDLPGPMEALSECVIHQHFEENVFGSFHVLKQVMPYLRDQRSGTILNFSSPAVVAATTGSTLYAATKLAIDSLSEALTAGIDDLGIQQTFVGPEDPLPRVEDLAKAAVCS